jgi:hypothetical protein
VAGVAIRGVGMVGRNEAAAGGEGGGGGVLGGRILGAVVLGGGVLVGVQVLGVDVLRIVVALRGALVGVSAACQRGGGAVGVADREAGGGALH